MATQTEKTLHHRLASCPQVESLGGCVVTGPHSHVVVSRGCRPLGIWTADGDGGFLFHDLANREPSGRASNVDEAHRQSIKLLKACQFGWAERHGPDKNVPEAA